MNYNEYIENNTLRLDYSRRGGGIEIDASEAVGIAGAKMTAYQNYLGGGLLGSINNSFNYDASDDASQELAEALKRYFHKLTNEEARDYDDWNSAEFDALQSRPESAY